MSSLEGYFRRYRRNIIGRGTKIDTPYGRKKLIYADWIASGRLYKDIEKTMTNKFGAYLGNTHTETSETGKAMTISYEYAKKIIKKHVNGSKDDIVFSSGSGMTDLINKLQRLLGLKLAEGIEKQNSCRLKCLNSERPVVFISHLEHHSNHISWLETIADLVIVKPAKDLSFSLDNLEEELKKYRDRRTIIGSFTACSNVTGVRTPYYDIAKLMHSYNGICIVDFSANAPYDNIDMHPLDKLSSLDAIIFSPHKFLGGPGSCGIMVVNKNLIDTIAPDTPGGGTVKWTDPWDNYIFLDNIEEREDGGTPAFLQTIRAALAIKLKEQIGVENIDEREKELLNISFDYLSKINGLHILQNNIKDRLGLISFYVDNIHHNLIVKILNDKFGVQVRGGCSCAGTFGHYLFNIDKEKSKELKELVLNGNKLAKPGWVRLSLHPTMSNKELNYILKAIGTIIREIDTLGKDYIGQEESGEFLHKSYYSNNNFYYSFFELA